MGLSEHVQSKLFLDDGVYSLWNRDVPDPPQTGTLPAQNMYGSHPFYMFKQEDEKWHGVYTNLAAATDWWIKNSGDQYASDKKHYVNITAFAAGGLGDMYLFSANSPNTLTKMYHNIVGKPVHTPLWALGWHQCRYGYKNTSQLMAVREGYNKSGIPLDTIWADIDYMQDFRDFTYDQTNFKGLPDFVKDLQGKYNMKFVPIIDAGIAQTNDDPAYNDGLT